MTLEIGQKLGCFTVLDKYQKPAKEGRSRLWITLSCECGTMFERNASTFVRSKPLQSCLCKNLGSRGFIRKSLTNSRKPLIDVLTNNKVSDYSRNAKAKGWEYSLTHEEVKALIQAPCHYCKHPGRTENQYWDYDPIFHNGIDRVDSSLGYVTANVVPCCVTCNFGKGPETLEEFNAWVKAITSFSPSLILYEGKLALNVAYNGLWNRTKSKATGRGKSFEFTQEEYFRLALANCYYCGAEPSNFYSNSKKHSYTLFYNGLDRKDNALGYTFENSLPCCWNCNRAKHKSTYEEFLAYIEDLKLA